MELFQWVIKITDLLHKHIGYALNRISAFVKKKAKWDKNPEWPAKYVETRFILNGAEYTLLPKDIGLTSDCWDQGFMESIQSAIKKDLEEYGAYDIYNFGFID